MTYRNNYQNSLVYSTLALAISGAIVGTANANETANEKVQSEIETIQVLGTRGSGLELSSSKILKVPGANNDPLKAIEALPGVILTPPATGGPVAEPAIRGSSSQDNYYETDFLEVGYTFHNDGLSTYNPRLIENFSLETGAWSSQFNDANGGLIVTKLRDPSFTESNTNVELSFIRASILHEGQINDDMAYYVSFRESLVHLYIENFIEDEDFTYPTPPRNNDYQTKLVWDLNNQDRLTFVATGANDKIETEFDEGSRDVAKNPDLESGELYEFSYNNQGVIWDRQLDRYRHKMALNHLSKEDMSKEGEILNLKADTDILSLKGLVEYDFDSGVLMVGGEYQLQTVDMNAAGRDFPCNDDFEMCPPSYFSPKFSTTEELDLDEVSGYVEWRQEIGKFDINVGVNASKYDYNDESLLEPRFKASLPIQDAGKLSFSVGRHHQGFKDFAFVSESLGNPELEQEKSTQYVLGYDYVVDEIWAVRAQLYYKELEDLIVTNPAAQASRYGEVIAPNTTRYFNEGEGQTYGAELLINKNYSDKWYGWVSIAYSHSDRTNNVTGEEFDYAFDLPWVVNMVASYDISNEWQVGAKWRYQSGRRYTQVTGSTPIYDPNSNAQSEPVLYQPIYEPFNESTLSAYHRLDIRVDYNTELWGQEANVFFEILNVYGNRSIQEFEYNADYSNYEKDYIFPDMPLPSIGINIDF